MFINNPGGNAQSQTGSLLLGGKKGVEYLLDNRIGNTGSVIDNPNDCNFMVVFSDRFFSYLYLPPPPDIDSQALMIRLTNTSLSCSGSQAVSGRGLFLNTLTVTL